VKHGTGIIILAASNPKTAAENVYYKVVISNGDMTNPN